MTRRQLLWLGVILLAGVVLGFLWRVAGPGSGPQGPPSGNHGASADAETSRALPTPADNSPASLIARFFAKLRGGDLKPGDSNALRKAILSAPRGEAIAALVRFLATGQDALTGEAFVVGDGGELAGAPTMRVLLLDLLGRLCRETRSPEALAVSRKLLENKTSADEWAIALRNVAWSAPNDTAYLAGKAEEMLRYQPWRQQPSAGYREAFDVIVYARAVPLIPELSQILAEEDRSLQTSAAVALDRLAEVAPLEAMNFLNQNRGELAQKPFLRADYFSKADFSQPAQRVAVETYLSRPDVQREEKAKLLAVLASPGSFASDTLLSEPPPEEYPPERIAALRKTVGEWLQTARFPELAGPLLQLQRQIAD